LAPAASAQTSGEPIVLNVREVKVPNKRGTVLQRGIFVQASCRPECVLVVKVRVPASVARRMGLSNRMVGSAVGFSTLDAVATFRVGVRRGARDAIARYRGGGSFEVRVTALP
jgi:hypothetical protein